MPRTVNNSFTTHGKDVLSSGAERVKCVFAVAVVLTWSIFLLDPLVKNAQALGSASGS